MKFLELSVGQVLTGLNELAQDQRHASRDSSYKAPTVTEAMNDALFLVQSLSGKLDDLSVCDDIGQVYNIIELATDGFLDKPPVHTMMRGDELGSSLYNFFIAPSVDKYNPYEVRDYHNLVKADKLCKNHPDSYFIDNTDTMAVRLATHGDAYYALKRAHHVITCYNQIPAKTIMKRSFIKMLDC